jgi:IrrE N-terminal-like domain
MIDTNRLYDIEVAAQSARALADRCFTDLRITLERVCDMALVAMVLTSGTADPTPNLTREGVRLAGVLEGSPLCPTLLFEQFDPVVRQQFSIAHELGHYFLHARRNGSSVPIAYHRCDQRRVDAEPVLDNTEAGDIEAEADAFAGAFLLPENEVRADLAHFGKCVAFLAERYGVSEATVRRRFKTLELVRA